MYIRDDSYIAKQGWVTILVAFLVASLIHYAGTMLWALPFWGIAFMLLVFFRNPNRLIPSLPLAIVSPVDGQVTAVEKIHDPYLDRDAVAIDLKIARLGPFVIRSATEGKFQEQFLPDPHRSAIWVQTDENDDVVVEISATLLNSRPRYNVNIGERIGQGQRCGFVWFSGRVRVLLPVNTRIDVNVSDNIIAGADVIATITRTTPVANENIELI